MGFANILNRLGSQKEPFFFCISYDMSKYEIYKCNDIPNDIQYKISNIISRPTSKVKLDKYLIGKNKYKNKFDRLYKHIQNGDTYLANLTTQTKIKTPYTMEQIYQNANAKYKLYIKDQFVCFSPETFIKCYDDKIYTYPMKGTKDASVPNAKDILIDDQKELAEHTMVVDLLRNDLSQIANNIKVEQFRHPHKIYAQDKMLWQTSSTISGVVGDNWHNRIGDILVSLLPAGSITGTPKANTIKILEKIEQYDRGYYTGIFGVYDGTSLDSAVMIRYIQMLEDGSLAYKSGGGITCDSVIDDEYDEMIQKIYL